MVVRILLTVVAFGTSLAGKYGDGDLDPNKSFVYVAVINLFSQVCWLSDSIFSFFLKE